SEAQRIVWVQSHMQAASPALLHAVNLEGRSYVVKELQPREDRLTFKKMDKAYPSFREAVQAMGNLLAWGQLRASGRRGAASGDALVEYAQGDSWAVPITDYAGSYAKRARADHKVLREAWKDGLFDRQIEKCRTRDRAVRSNTGHVRAHQHIGNPLLRRPGPIRDPVHEDTNLHVRQDVELGGLWHCRADLVEPGPQNRFDLGPLRKG